MSDENRNEVTYENGTTAKGKRMNRSQTPSYHMFYMKQNSRMTKMGMKALIMSDNRFAAQ